MVPDGWTLTQLQTVLDGPIKNGYSPVAATTETGYWVLSLGALSDNGLAADQIKPVEPEQAVLKSLLSEGDFLVSRSNTPDKVGRSARFRGEPKNCSYPDLMMRFRVDGACADENFIEQKLKSHQVRSYYRSRAAGSSNTMVKINKTTVEETPLLLPPLPEQTKIAKILSIWGEAIETTEKLIKNSKAQKNALIQQLLTGKKRYSQFIDSDKKRKMNYGDLPLDWLFLPIGDIASEQSERAGKNSELPVLSCSKHHGFVDSLQYFKKKVYSDDTSNYKVVRRGCYGFPSNHIEEGSIGYQDICDAGIVSPIYSVFETSERVHDGYLFRLLKTEHYRQIFQARTNASVDRRGSLRWKEFCKINVPLPSLAEQQKISETIDAADNELANLSSQLVQLRAQKRALMQQLLTGKRRVKVAA